MSTYKEPMQRVMDDMDAAVEKTLGRYPSLLLSDATDEGVLRAALESIYKDGRLDGMNRASEIYRA